MSRSRKSGGISSGRVCASSSSSRGPPSMNLKRNSGVQEGTAFLPGSSLAGNGLLVSDGPVWRRQRQLSNPAFRSAAVQAYAKVWLPPLPPAPLLIVQAE